MSTDPITAAINDIGRLCIHISCNDIASNGIQPVGILLAVLLPVGTTEEQIAEMMKQAGEASAELGVEIIGGHTEITDAVKQPVITSTAIGRGPKGGSQSADDIVPGDFLLITKKAGIEGTGVIARDKADELAEFMLIVLPFVWGLPFGLVASELGSVRPQEGGYYKWVQEAFGEFWGFQAGWWRTVSIYIDNTLYVILAGGYAATEWHLSSIQEFILKAAMIIIFTYINVRGVKDVGIVSTVLSVIVIASFAAAAIVGFMGKHSLMKISESSVILTAVRMFLKKMEKCCLIVL